MKKILFGGLIALTALAASCSKNEGPEIEGGEATVTIRIDNATRANPVTGVEDAEIQKAENILKSFTAYVFNYSTGRLEAKATGNLETKSVRISGLNSATNKTVVVTANTEVDIEVGGNYSEFEQKLMDLDNEPVDYDELIGGTTKGFAMFGKNAPVSLNEGDGNSTTVSLERLVAKVTLSKLTVKIETDEDAEGYLGYDETDLANFKVKGVTMQKVIGKAGFLGHNSGVLYGGMTGAGLTSTVQKTYLIDNGWDHGFTNGQEREIGNYFYVMPNDGADAEYTMLTVIAKYYDQDVYFPVIINKSKEEGSDNTVGKVVNNTWYTLELTIKDLLGSVDPETPKGEASLDVTVVVKDWTPAPTQVEEW